MMAEGLMFYATIETEGGELLHRETVDRRELLEWLYTHSPMGRIQRVSVEARSPESISNMVAAITRGAAHMKGYGQ